MYSEPALISFSFRVEINHFMLSESLTIPDVAWPLFQAVRSLVLSSYVSLHKDRVLEHEEIAQTVGCSLRQRNNSPWMLCLRKLKD
jgi:hypothetical protein